MSVRVFLNHLGKRLPVGLLSMTDQGMAFEYCEDFLRRGIGLSPYFMPLRPGVHSATKSRRSMDCTAPSATACRSF